MADEPCVCGSGQLGRVCCGPILADEPAKTAVALMRSRYTAYVQGAIDHVVATTDPAARAAFDRDAALSWSRNTSWMGLEIVGAERGGEADDEGSVEFIARGVTSGTPFAQHERSRFRRIDGAWYYVDGTIIHAPARRTQTAGRNDPCPCGSGQKYKRCHG